MFDNWYKWGSIALISFLMVSCYDDTVNNPLLDDIPPVIRMIAPDSTSILGRSGDSISFILLLADNVGLDSLYVYQEVIGVEGGVIDSRKRMDAFPITGKELEFVYSLALPIFPTFSQIFYEFEVADQNDARDVVSQKVTLLPNDFLLLGEDYKVNTYRNKRLYSKLSDSLSGFNFTTQQSFSAPFTFPLDVDIAENSSETDFSPILISPNNTYFQEDSIFVMTDTSLVNFVEANYQIISSIYHTSGEHFKETPVLGVGDMVLIRLIKAPRSQFALLRVKAINDEAGSENDYIVFDYKVSSE